MTIPPPHMPWTPDSTRQCAERVGSERIGHEGSTAKFIAQAFEALVGTCDRSSRVTNRFEDDLLWRCVCVHFNPCVVIQSGVVVSESFPSIHFSSSASWSAF